jgi:hypothetical protein
MPDGKWLYFLAPDKLSFAPLDLSCVVAPFEVTQIDSVTLSPSGEQMALEHEGDIYLLDLDQVLGMNREKLVCPGA